MPEVPHIRLAVEAVLVCLVLVAEAFARPGAEYLTIQETAWVLGMGVRTARLLYREAGFERGQRKKIMTS
ncbi:hypothetical protein KBZ21_41360, partial [Streptomyces sp. A73]|nr:hypothetical protein [Streptomyces sp. A73]